MRKASTLIPANCDSVDMEPLPTCAMAVESNGPSSHPQRPQEDADAPQFFDTQCLQILICEGFYDVVRDTLFLEGH